MNYGTPLYDLGSREARLERKKKLKSGEIKTVCSIPEYRVNFPKGRIPPVKDLSSTHRIAGKLLGMGWSQKKVREHTGIGEGKMTQLMRTPLFRDLIRVETDRFMDRVASQISESAPRARLNLSAVKAVDRLDKVLERDSEESDLTAVRAADVVLKHALPKDDGAVAVGGVTINITGEKDRDLKALEDGIEAKLKKGAIDVECEEERGDGDREVEDEAGEAGRDLEAGGWFAGCGRPRF